MRARVDESAAPVGRFDHAITLRPERGAEQTPHPGFVLDHEDRGLRAHALTVSAGTCGASSSGNVK